MKYSVDDMKRDFYLVKPRDEMFVAFARDIWDSIADDVREEFRLENVSTFGEFLKELNESDNSRFLLKKGDGRVLVAVWSGTVPTGMRTFGCIVRNSGMSASDKMMIANISGSVLDWYMETEPDSVKRMFVVIPAKFKRLNRHASELVHLVHADSFTADDGTEFNVYVKERRSLC